ncbi:MAG: gluconate 2-dehydrogenase subunit 3 family protein [Bacteroidales bacterium]
MHINRRSFLKTGAAGFGSIMLMPSCLQKVSPYQFFTLEEANCVIALCEQIIPADQYGGGATEAGVINYIDRQLVAVFDYDQLIYQQGVEALQQSCIELYGKRFENLEQDLQPQILKTLESKKLPGNYWGDLDPLRFFGLVINHTMQGFYGAPRHGGNKNYMSYKMMGLDFPLVVGRNHYAHLS